MAGMAAVVTTKVGIVAMAVAKTAVAKTAVETMREGVAMIDMHHLGKAARNR